MSVSFAIIVFEKAGNYNRDKEKEKKKERMPGFFAYCA
jgi:hypothetical protein